ncbi:hypothetical protein [Kitasatospora sp. HPMI-4]|uniref:hypothetical protein n=1 Tax=Kitasatospora sp. HPMI-4 TaxID=3448443 RepID=UPI003F1DA9F9
MTIIGEDRNSARGHVLLLAAAPRASRRRLLDPELGVNALATVAPSALLPGWTGAVDLVQVVDPGEPQAVLARLQTAATAGGPLLVYLCGQLIRDHRQRQIHLALRATTPRTIRYTALPWAWLARELARRPPGTTALVLDLVADPSCLPMQPEDLQLPDHITPWGAVAPPVRRGPWQAPAYTLALADLLRHTPGNRHLAELHALAAGQAQLAPGTVLLAPPAPPLPEVPRPRPAQQLLATIPTPTPAPPAAEPVTDLRPAIAQAMHAGHHHAAAELAAQWERAVLRSAGLHSPLMGDVLEVQATIAAAAGTDVRAADRWLATAEHRLQWTDPQQETVKLAARNALACWQALDDDEPQLEELGRRLAAVLRTVGAPRRAAAAEARLAELQEPVVYSPPPGWSR